MKTSSKVLEFNIPNYARMDLLRELQLIKSSEYLNELALHAQIQINQFLPPTFLDALYRFKSGWDMPGALLIRGLPIDPVLPQTPIDLPPEKVKLGYKKSVISEACLLGISRLLGEIYSYAQEKNGELIHNIHPVRAKEHTPSNEGSDVDFRLHRENAYFEFNPHFILLYCLRAGSGEKAYTTISDVNSAVSHLSDKHLSVLQQPLFKIQIPNSFSSENTNGNLWSLPLPVLKKASHLWEARLNFNGVTGVSREADDALLAFEQALHHDDVLKRVLLFPGEMLILNNRKALHGRTPFKANFDGFDRWLQRVYVHTDPWFGLQFAKKENLLFSWQHL